MYAPLKANIVANFLGQSWRALMAFAFVPLYVRYLGIEAFGLIGIFTLLQAWIATCDMGLRVTLSREMARFTGGAMDASAIRDVLRTIETLVLPLGIAAALAVWATSGWLAVQWVKPEHLSPDTVATAFAIMGIVVALRFAEGMYIGCLTGLQRQVVENVATIASSTARSLGAVLVIAFVSPTIEAFFLWQGLVSLASIGGLAALVYRILPPGTRAARPAWTTLQSVWRFAAGATTITFVSLLTIQADKILLSRTVSLEKFGYYAMATAIAAVIVNLAGPVTAAFGPRFTQLVTLRDEAAVRSAYHRAAQLVTVIAATAAAMFVTLGDQIMLLWTGDSALAREVVPLLRILAIAAFLQSTMYPPYFMQLAYGWTSLAAGINIAALCLITPALLWAIPYYGVFGAAWVLVCLTVLYLSAGIILMHRRILRGEMGRWYLADVFIPALAAAATAGACALAFPRDVGSIASGTALVGSTVLVLAAAAFSAGELRNKVFGLVHSVSGSLRPRALMKISGGAL